MAGENRLSRESTVPGAIDIHTHILPGVDDGAKSRDEALAMAKAAQERGTVLVVATPHADFAGRRWQGVASTIRSSVAALNAVFESSGLSVRVLPGMEIAVHPRVLELLNRGEALTIGDAGKYVLVELPFQQIPTYAEKAVFDLSSAGYVPVIAHPERCVEVATDPNRMYQLVRAGAMGQVNAGSLAGAFGKSVRQVAETLLRHGLAHVIASDGHSPEDRPCRLDLAFAAASRLVGREAALRAVRDVPHAIVHAETVQIEDPEEYVRRKWFLFGETGA
ncbi:MAG: tyrosine-protein phosphatase [Betaproteobacteria bacterium]